MREVLFFKKPEILYTDLKEIPVPDYENHPLLNYLKGEILPIPFFQEIVKTYDKITKKNNSIRK